MRYKFGRFIKSEYMEGNTSNNKEITTEPFVALGYGKSINENEPLNEPVARPEGLNVYQLIFLKQGKMQFNIDGEAVIYGPNTIVLYKPQQPQFYSGCDNEKNHRMFILFSGSEVESYLRKYNLEDLKVSIPSETFNAFEDTINRMDACRFNPHYSNICALLLEELFAHISYAIEDKQTKGTDFNALHHFMMETCHKNYPIKVYADFVNFSEVYFVRFFKKAMGTTPHQYLLNLRFQKACQLLVNTNDSIKEIAIRTGFLNPHYFSKAFNTKFKMTPTEYRIGYKNKRILPNEINDDFSNFEISEDILDI